MTLEIADNIWDGHYADAASDTDGEFLFNVVGVVDNPFADFV